MTSRHGEHLDNLQQAAIAISGERHADAMLRLVFWRAYYPAARAPNALDRGIDIGHHEAEDDVAGLGRRFAEKLEEYQWRLDMSLASVRMISSIGRSGVSASWMRAISRMPKAAL